MRVACLVRVWCWSRHAEGDRVQEEIETIVRRISQSYPGTIFYELRAGISTAARMLLWQQSDVAVFSAVREAVNVWPLEYVLTRSLPRETEKPERELAGVLVLSEFSGFSRVLNGALRVNPFSQKQLQEVLPPTRPPPPPPPLRRLPSRVPWL